SVSCNAPISQLRLVVVGTEARLRLARGEVARVDGVDGNVDDLEEGRERVELGVAHGRKVREARGDRRPVFLVELEAREVLRSIRAAPLAGEGELHDFDRTEGQVRGLELHLPGGWVVAVDPPPGRVAAAHDLAEVRPARVRDEGQSFRTFR